LKQLTLAADKHLFGYQGEQDAAQRARARGYLLLERNYRTPYGEIDLILRSPEGELVFAEVKARSGTFFGYPEEAVDRRKNPISSARHIIIFSSGFRTVKRSPGGWISWH